MKEIERKFILKDTSILNSLDYIKYKRYFLYLDENIEIRIQRKGDKYEFERKISNSQLQAEKQKFELTENEFEELKKKSIYSLKRKSYLYLKEPEISIKIYEEDFKGLNRIEVEFNSVEEAESFEIPNWFGKEITNSKLGKDKILTQLSQIEFNELLKEFKE